MAIQKVPVETNFAVKGLITEVSPLTFPENASLDEKNFVLKRTGLRKRRLGLDKIGDPTAIPTVTESTLSYSSFEWENAGGDAQVLLLVVQYGNVLMIFDTANPDDSSPVLVQTYDIRSVIPIENAYVQQGDYATVDGLLVCTFGEHAILKIEYDPEEQTFSRSSTYLRMRDQFGVTSVYLRPSQIFQWDPEMEDDGDFQPLESYNLPPLVVGDLSEDEFSSIRPTETLPNGHRYNLRNQSWGRARESLNIRQRKSDIDLSSDPIEAFFEYWNSYPSNSDAVGSGLINYAELEGAPTRFIPEELGKTPLASSSAPKGFFIIDALRRGISRNEGYNSLITESVGSLSLGLTEQLKDDTTPYGATCIAEFAGRVWYSGFSGKIVDGDTRSPRMSSYVLFSQLVVDPSNIDKCYQKNDPTYEQEADLLATDGGFIRIDEAYGIKRLISMGDNLAVLATNGTWIIRGGTDNGFTAESYIVDKITDQGILSAQSAVDNGSGVLYWANSGIYSIAPNQFDSYEATDITKSTIQTFYEKIPNAQKANASGVFDRYENKIRWTYGTNVSGDDSYELVLDIDLQAFYPNEIKALDTDSPVVLFPLIVRSYRSVTEDTDVEVGTDQVLSDTDEVSIKQISVVDNEVETLYTTLWSQDNPSIAFASYKDSTFKDWKSKDDTGVDAEAYMVTGYGPQGDFQRRKQVPFITTYMVKTEDGFELVNGDLVPTNQSSCKMQARWEWHDSPNGNRWGRENQVYRNKRFYLPEDGGDKYDIGESVLTSKTKLRGKGKTLSLLFKTEPEKDCQLLGWSMIVDVSSNV